MARDENEAVARRLIEAHNRDGAVLLDELFAPDYVDRTAPPGQADAAARKRQIAAYRAAFPDLRATLDEMVSAGDKVWLRWTTTGTHGGAPLETPLGTVPADGRPARVGGVNVLRVADGRIAEEWIFWDRLGWLQQLGALPAATGA